MTRAPISSVLVARIENEARGFFLDSRGSHDWDHTKRVLRLCLRIGRKEGADLDILKLAALLHDIGRGQEDRSGGRVCHGRTGAAMAGKLMALYGIDAGTIRDVVHCIRTHRFRKKAVPQTLEAKVLFDADKLDSIGAVGIGRAFLFAGEVGARLHDKEINLRKTKPYTRDDTAYREFLVKLGRVKDRMFTREGKLIAAERHRFMVQFFDRLNRETDGSL
jgi:uncharacterized protein